MATPLAFFRNAFLGIVELKPSGNRVRHIVSSLDDAVAGAMGRPRTRNARHSNAQCTHLFISKSRTFCLQTPILLLAAINRIAAHRKYTVRQIRQKTPVAPLCEWKNLSAKRLNWSIVVFGYFHSTLRMPRDKLTASYLFLPTSDHDS